MKVCRKCSEAQPLTEFHKNISNRDDLDSRCKGCRKSHAHEAYKLDWFSVTCKLKKSWCKTRGVDFDLDGPYLEGIWTSHCPVFGTAFKRHEKGDDNCPALDRIDPEGGYVKGNVCYVSSRANRIKYNATIEELRLVIEYMQALSS